MEATIEEWLYVFEAFAKHIECICEWREWQLPWHLMCVDNDHGGHHDYQHTESLTWFQQLTYTWMPICVSRIWHWSQEWAMLPMDADGSHRPIFIAIGPAHSVEKSLNFWGQNGTKWRNRLGCVDAFRCNSGTDNKRTAIQCEWKILRVVFLVVIALHSVLFFAEPIVPSYQLTPFSYTDIPYWVSNPFS